MASLLDNVDDGLRMWRRHPGLVAAVLSVALGIGANATMFRVMHATLLRELPFPDAYRLMTIWNGGFDDPENPDVICWPPLQDVQARLRSLASRAVFEGAGAAVSPAVPTSPGSCRHDA